VEQDAANLGPTYTNALQFKARLQILKDRQDLKYAALDCWKTIAELLPDGLQLEVYHFSDGKRLALDGTAPLGEEKQLLEFEKVLRKAVRDGQPMFEAFAEPAEQMRWDPPRGGVIPWHCVLKLKRTEEL
jgi:hypothetical protein